MPASRSRPNSSFSDLVSRETTTSTPCLRQPSTSSSSQSPPLGREEIPSCRGNDFVNQYIFGFNRFPPVFGWLHFDNYLTWQMVHIHASRSQDRDPVMAIENGPIRPDFE